MSKTLTKTKPIYDIHQSYLDNAKEGPFFDDLLPERHWPDEANWIDFLGFRIASPIGVPAGPLLNSKWTTFASRFGYDIITYKTIRSYEHESHPIPNVILVDTDGELTYDRMGEILKKKEGDQSAPDELAITNSFGNPSRCPDYLSIDIHLASHAIEKGQVLIVSVFGTGTTSQELSDDYVRAACLAKEAGANIIEVNFSCPNLLSGTNLYLDNDISYKIAKSVAQAISPTPLVVKLGIFDDPEKLKQTLLNLSRAGVRAVCGINTVPMKVVDKSGNPALGEGRLQSGICGSPIRSIALDFIYTARSIIDQKSLDLTLLGCGGVTLPEHFDLFFDAGADITLTATGMMWDPYLALKWHSKQLSR